MFHKENVTKKSVICPHWILLMNNQLESLPKEILTKILLELNTRDGKNMLCSSVIIRNKCLDVLLEKWPLVLLYDSKNQHNPFKRKLIAQYKSSNNLLDVLNNSQCFLEYYRIAHFKNKSTGDITVKYLKLIKKKHPTKVKSNNPNVIFNMLEKCTRLRLFKMDVSDIKYFIQLMDKLPNGLKAIEINITTPKFYKGKIKPIHVSKMKMTALNLKSIKINGNSKFYDSFNKTSKEIRDSINLVGDLFPNEGRVNQFLFQSYDRDTGNSKLQVFCKIIAQLVFNNCKSLESIEIFNMDAYLIMKYKRVLSNLSQLRVIKIDPRSLPRFHRWESRFYDVCVDKRVLVPNMAPVYPWLIVFPWDSLKAETCCGIQKHCGNSIVQCKMTGTAVLFWKHFKYA